MTKEEYDELFKKCAEKLAKPGAWIQEHVAMRADGKWTGGTDQNAVAWCSIGVIRSLTSDSHSFVYATNEFSKRTGVGSISKWNDSENQTQKNVVDTFLLAAGVAE